MKNFRKVLALVLVVATLFSFTAMAGAAYKDEAAISYDEAVAVLSAVGILNGYEDSTFKPTQTISREEMAKMIAVLANAGDDVSTLYASASTFADVPASKWSASYVAYCAKTGIVAGRSASTFDPAGKVTGLETAKMLLVTLGFDANEQGYVGADWKVNVLRDAKVMGLLNNFAADYDVDAALTREEAAQMMLNALQAPCVVGIISDGLVTITNALIVNWPGAGNVNIANLLNISVYAKLQDAIKAGKWCLYGNVVISNDLLCDRLYDMEKGTGYDCYGRPSTIWMINGEKVAYFNETPVWSSYNTSAAVVAEKVGKLTKTPTYFFNGFASSAAEAEKVIGKGVLVEIYADGEVVMIETYIGYVGQMDTARGKFMVLDAGKNTLRKADNTNGFTKADEGTMILYWECNETKDNKKADNFHAIEVAEFNTVEVHGVRSAKENFCDAKENTYEFHNGVEALTAAAVGKTYEIVVDKYGYVLYVGAPAAAAAKVSVLVSDSAWKTNGKQSANDDATFDYFASFVDFEDGAKATEYAADLDAFTTDKDADHDVLVTYNAKGEARLATDAADELKLEKDATFIMSSKGKIEGLEKVANDYTQYILRVWNYAEGKFEYKYFDGKGEVDAAYVLNHVQYIAGNDPYIEYIYAEAKYAESSDLAFVMSFETDETYAGCIGEETYVTYYLYNALVNGEEALVAYEEKLTDELMQMFEAKYVLIEDAASHDDLPIYVAETEAIASVGEEFVIKGNTLTFKDGDELKAADMAAKANIWVVTNVDGDIAVKTIADYDDVADYLSYHNWTTQYAWVDGTPVDTIVLYCIAGE